MSKPYGIQLEKVLDPYQDSNMGSGSALQRQKTKRLKIPNQRDTSIREHVLAGKAGSFRASLDASGNMRSYNR